jgi:hypothetical protein
LISAVIAACLAGSWPGSVASVPAEAVAQDPPKPPKPPKDQPKEPRSTGEPKLKRRKPPPPRPPGLP